MIRVLIADNHNAMRAGLVLLLNQQDGIRVVDDVPDGRSAMARMRQGGIDIALIDMMMPDMEGDEVIRAVLAGDGWKPRMVIYSGFVDKGLVRRAMEAGACGYLDKGAGILETVKVIQAVARGEVCLCPKALDMVGEEVVADAVRANSRRAFRVSTAEIVDEFLAQELAKEDPGWPNEVKKVYRCVIALVTKSDAGTNDILKKSGIRGYDIRRRYRAIVGTAIKGHQSNLRLRIAEQLQTAGYSAIDVAFASGFNSTAAMSNAKRRHRP